MNKPELILSIFSFEFASSFFGQLFIELLGSDISSPDSIHRVTGSSDRVSISVRS